MSKKQIPIFATEGDLSALIARVSHWRPLKFVRAGLFDEPMIDAFQGPIRPHAFATYLVLDRDRAVSVRIIPQRNGGKKYAVDQLDNRDSVSLQIGGMIDDDRLVAGQIGTATNEPSSAEIFSLFARAIEDQFVKIKSYYVGPEAMRLLDRGIRLTPTSKSPKDYDLVR